MDFSRFITRAASALLALALASGSLLSARAAQAGDGHVPSVSAKSAVLVDAANCGILYQNNPDAPLPMASTTKIMTALVALSSGVPLDRQITVTQAMCGIEGSSLYLKPGERLTLLELLYGLMLKSGNDAAVAVAIGVAGSPDRFVGMMNSAARAMGLRNTHFENVNGLDIDGHYTTAYELAKITSAALQIPMFREIVSTWKIVIPLRTSHSVTQGAGPEPPLATPRLLVNHNRLLKLYDGAIGVKTGYTMKTGRCLVSAAQRGGMTLIAVTLSDPDDWDDHMAMLDYGFDSYETVQLIQAGHFVSYVPVTGGAATFVRAVADAEITASLPKDAERALVHSEIYLPRFVSAPVRAGDELGWVSFSYDGQVLGKTALVARDGADAVDSRGFWERLFKK